MPSLALRGEDLRRWNLLLGTIAAELDLPVDELDDDDAEFADLGIDPIVAPSIIAKIAQATGLRLADNAFQQFGDVGSLKQHVAATWASASTSTATATVTATATAPPKPLSVLIRGNRAKATKNVFLLPDGSGSAMAYARIPALAPEYCLYALNSPFLQAAGAYTCSIEEIAGRWVEEIETIQPRGPYIFGGWSAGGYYAYEVTKLFQRKGAVVEKLILIDSPSRTDFEALPLDVVLFLSSHNLMGNWGNTQTPPWLVQHFEATLKAVDRYTPAPLTTALEVFVIWASDALLGAAAAAATGLDLDVKVSRFLLADRGGLGPHGWDTLFPGSTMVIGTMPGNHFNLIHPPNVRAPVARRGCASLLTCGAQVEALGSLLRDVVQARPADRTNAWRRVEGGQVN
jgi:thioesterase domain-containing protein/acyl carrier protein